MSDYVIRAIAADGEIRAFAASTRETVEEARRRHNTSPVVTAALGRLMTASLMMGAQMKGTEDKLTLSIKGDGPVKSLIAIADAHGHVKGYAGEPQVLIHANEKGKLDVAGAIGKGELTITRDLELKEPYVGTCELVSGEIAEDLTYYYATSEQTPSSVALGVLMNRDNTVRQAGGFIIQLMPGVSDETIDALEKTINAMKPISTLLDEEKTPEDILQDILGPFGLEITEKDEVCFACDCSREKVAAAVASIGKYDLLDLMLSREAVEAKCDYCNTSYTFHRPELKALYKEYYLKK